MPEPTSTYAGAPGGPRDPNTPGSYCLARCYCGTCPQYAKQQAATELLRQQEYEKRIRQQARRDAERRHRRSAA